MSEEEKKGAYQALTELKRALIIYPDEGPIYKSDLLTLVDNLRSTYLTAEREQEQ